MALYTSDDKMATLIADNFNILQVMSRFGIKVGFGDMTVKEVCEQRGTDCATFLAVVNLLMGADSKTPAVDEISVQSLLDYLRSSHTYFLEYCFPAIKRKLIEGIRMRADDVSFLIMKMFDEYVDEVRTHMEYEERTLFTYVSGTPDGESVTTYSEHHEQVGDKLRELKSIILKYCPDDADVNRLNSVLHDIYRTEKELESHCLVEDRLLVPALRNIEIKPDVAKVEKDDEESKEALSQREKEIVALVAKGLTNKEIAEALFLSVHTVITHRRNIARKLEIHSATGLTIYAIVNHLVDLKEIKL